jgi:macrolide transport system ATP-binding/permease protein
VSRLLQDLKYAARMLGKRPAFTAVAALTLALGIGANTAIFSVVNGVLLQRLPVGDPEALVLFSETNSEGTSQTDGIMPTPWQRFSSADYRHFLERVPAFSGLAAFRSGEDRLSVVAQGGSPGERTQLARGHLVSGNYFGVLEAHALHGRTLSADDDRPGAMPAAVVSYGYWHERWADDPSVVGKTVALNGEPFTIVGVMPPSFFGERVRRAPDFWLPLSFQPVIEHRESYAGNQQTYWLGLIGRLRAGAGLDRAEAQVNVALRQLLAQQFGEQLSPEQRARMSGPLVRLVPGGSGISFLRSAYGERLRVLMAVAVFVLLIACANVASLMLSLAAARRPEVAMRLALGASRWRLVRQLLTESVLLAVLGGAAGLALAEWGVRVLKALVARTSPVDVGLSLRVLVFTLLVSLVAGVLFGLAPALRAGRGDLATSMRERGEGASAARRGPKLAPALVVAQVALSLVLLLGAGLLVRSLVNLTGESVGFARDGVLLVDIDTRLSGYGSAELAGYYARLIERVSRVPGVRSATVATYSPMSGSSRTNTVAIQGFRPEPHQSMDVETPSVGPGYAETLGLPVVAGRELTERDAAGSPPVVVVNQAFARAYFGGRNPVGGRLGFSTDHDGDFEIVGVLGDARFRSVRDAPVPMVFFAILQVTGQSAYTSELEVRTATDPSSLTPAVRAAVAEVDARVPIAGVTTLAAQLTDSLGRDALFARLVGVFSALALVLACVGLYGLVSQAVARRTNELGVRMALGADAGIILRMVLRDAGALILLGLAIGVPAALGAARVIRSQLFGVGPADPATLVATCGVLAAVAMAAGFFPARRAARVDPMVALHAE